MQQHRLVVIRVHRHFIKMFRTSQRGSRELKKLGKKGAKFQVDKADQLFCQLVLGSKVFLSSKLSSTRGTIRRPTRTRALSKSRWATQWTAATEAHSTKGWTQIPISWDQTCEAASTQPQTPRYNSKRKLSRSISNNTKQTWPGIAPRAWQRWSTIQTIAEKSFQCFSKISRTRLCLIISGRHSICNSKAETVMARLWWKAHKASLWTATRKAITKLIV